MTMMMIITCQSGLDGGWPMTFYVPGTTGLVWCFLFYILIYSTPKDHPRSVVLITDQSLITHYSSDDHP